MKKSLQVTKILGVTLLEIMLVLAIAAMVIVMSIKYYQSASNNQKINAALSAVTSVIAAGESYLAGAGSFTAASNTTFAPYAPDGVIPSSPWGTTLTVGGPAATSYTITIAVANAACSSLKSSLLQNTKLTSTTPCPGAGVAGTTGLVVTVNQ